MYWVRRHDITHMALHPRRIVLGTPTMSATSDPHSDPVEFHFIAWLDHDAAAVAGP